MYTCSKCNYQTESEANFCPLCGNQLVKDEPVQPVQQVTYSYQPAPQPQYAPNVQGPHLAMKIVGMSLGITGFVFAFFAFIYTMPLLGYDEAIIMPFVFSFFSAPASIVGLIFSIKNANEGDTSAFSKVGKIFAIIGLALIGFTFFMALIACA